MAKKEEKYTMKISKTTIDQLGKLTISVVAVCLVAIVFSTAQPLFSNTEEGTTAESRFELTCEDTIVGGNNTVTASAQLGSEIKYEIKVRNLSDSYLELDYRVDPVTSPYGTESSWYPQPSFLYLQPGEVQSIWGFEGVPRIPEGINEVRYTRKITVFPKWDPLQENSPNAKFIILTTTVNNVPLAVNSIVRGHVRDSQTREPIVNAEVLLEHEDFVIRTSTRSDGSYEINCPSLDYQLTVKADGYEIYNNKVKASAGNTATENVYLDRVLEKVEYHLAKKLKLDAGAWEGVWRVAVSEDEKYIALGTGGKQKMTENYNGYLYFYDIDGDLLWKNLTQGAVGGLDISRDSAYVAMSIFNVSEQNVEKVYLFDKNGQLVWSRFPTGDPFREIRISNNGKYIATGDITGNLYLLYRENGETAWQSFVGGQVRAIKFYRDDSHLLVGSGSGYIYLYDINGNLKWRMYVYSWPYGFIATTPDYSYVAAGGHLSFLPFIHNEANESASVLWTYETSGGFRWAEISPDTSFVVAGTRYGLVLLDRDGQILWEDRGFVSSGSRGSMSGMITPDGKHILSGDQGGQVSIRNLRGTVLWIYGEGGESVGRDVRFSYITSDGSKIVAATLDGYLYFFEGEWATTPSAGVPPEGGVSPFLVAGLIGAIAAVILVIIVIKRR